MTSNNYIINSTIFWANLLIGAAKIALKFNWRKETPMEDQKHEIADLDLGVGICISFYFWVLKHGFISLVAGCFKAAEKANTVH